MSGFVSKTLGEVIRETAGRYPENPALVSTQFNIRMNYSELYDKCRKVARGLMAKPTILMLDEPSLGLAPIIINDVFKTIQTIKENGVTILLVEQNAAMALSIADRAYVLETGRIVLEGDAKSVLRNPQIREAYLG